MDANRLDNILPLRDASHRDAVSYSVDIPMRYAECCVTLRDGRTARLRDGAQFEGWTGVNGSRRLLFSTEAGRIVLTTDRQIDACNAEKFTARDGNLKFIR